MKPHALRVMVIAILAAFSPAAPAWSQLCSGDEPENISLTHINQSNVLTIFTRTRLNHASAHGGCAGIVKARAELWIGSHFAGCSVNATNSAATATNSNAFHEKTAQRQCVVNQCSSVYQTRGRHYFNGVNFESTYGNTAEAGQCGSCNPCSEDGYSPGQVCPVEDQDYCGCCLDPSPLIIDRSGDGLHFSAAEDGVLFKVNGRRLMLWLGWPTSTDDAWLALDRNGNGVVDNGSELFGNTRELASGWQAQNGYEVLAELDENGDKVVDANDPAFAKLLLWGDENRNGVCEPRELSPLSSSRVRSLGLDYQASKERDIHGNRFRFVATDGSTTDVFPVWDRPDSGPPPW